MVEDEALILEIMTETLEEAGYDVITAIDGPTALALADARHDHFTALISDYHLPGGLTGLDVASALRRHRPGLPVMLATGRPDVLSLQLELTGGFVLLQKPYRPTEMLRKLAALVPPHHPGRASIS